jgi:hypothetical protein
VIGIKCERCGRTFKEERALLLHYERSIKSSMVSECGNDQTMKAKGLTQSVNGYVDGVWEVERSELTR